MRLGTQILCPPHPFDQKCERIGPASIYPSGNRFDQSLIGHVGYAQDDAEDATQYEYSQMA
jgi:hypothetical protein